MTKKTKNEILGWTIVSKLYSLKDICKDGIIPLIIALSLECVIVVAAIFIPLDLYIILDKVTTMIISILPMILALLLAGYTIVLTLFWSEYGKKIRKYKSGKQLLQNINAAFAGTIRIMVFELIFAISIAIILSLKIPAYNYIIAFISNATLLFVSIIALIFSIWSLKDITINIFNLGQILPKFEDDDKN